MTHVTLSEKSRTTSSVPMASLNPGSVSVAVDRLYKKGLVSRMETESDRRVRTVSLTEKWRVAHSSTVLA